MTLEELNTRLSTVPGFDPTRHELKFVAHHITEDGHDDTDDVMLVRIERAELSRNLYLHLR